MSDQAIQALESQMDGGKDTSIEVSGGSPSFEDFDQMEMAREQYVNAKTQEGEQLKKQMEEKQDDDSDKEPSEPKDESEEHEERTEKDKNVDPNLAPQPDKAEVKMLKLMDGDNPIEINQDAMVTVTVDGEEQQLSIRDLRDQFSGKVAWDKRFTELDKDRKAAEKQVDQATRQMQVFRQVVEMLKGEDPASGLAYALDIAGVNSRSALQSLVQKLYGDIDELADMTQEERRQHFLIKENEFLRKRDETSLERQRRQSRIRERGTQLSRARESRGLSEQQYVDGYNWIVENTQLPKEQITADRIGETALDLISVKLVNEVLTSVNKQLLDDQSVYSETFKFVRDKAVGLNPTHTKDDVIQIVRETLGLEAGKAVAEKKPQLEEKKTGEVETENNEEQTGTEMFGDFDGYYQYGDAGGRNVL